MIERVVELAVRCGLMRVGKGSCCLRRAWTNELTCEVLEYKVPNRRQNLLVEEWVECELKQATWIEWVLRQQSLLPFLVVFSWVGIGIGVLGSRLQGVAFWRLARIPRVAF